MNRNKKTNDELVFIIQFKNTTLSYGFSKKSIQNYYEESLYYPDPVLINSLIFIINYILEFGTIESILLEKTIKDFTNVEEIILHNIKELYVNNKLIDLNEDFSNNLNIINKIQINFDLSFIKKEKKFPLIPINVIKSRKKL